MGSRRNEPNDTLEIGTGNQASEESNHKSDQPSSDSNGAVRIEDTVETYYRKYGPSVARRCNWLLGDAEKARDAVHEVFVQLLIRKDKKPIRNPSSFLFRMATNICINLIEREKRRREIPGETLLEKIVNLENIEEQTIIQDLLDRVFDREPASSKELAVMVFIDQMTYQEVADELHMSVSGVKKRLSKLRQRLNHIEGGRYEA